MKHSGGNLINQYTSTLTMWRSLLLMLPARENQQKHSNLNRWSIFNIRIKIITMSRQDQYPVKLFCEIIDIRARCKISKRVPVIMLAVVTLNSSHESGDRLLLVIHHFNQHWKHWKIFRIKYVFLPDFPIPHICFDKVFMLILFDLWSKLSSF